MPNNTETRSAANIAASPVTQAQLTQRLEKFGNDLTAKLNAAIAAAVAASIKDWQDSLEVTKHELDVFKELSMNTINALNRRVEFLEQQVNSQLLWNNEREQRSRSRTFRLHNHRTSCSDAPSSMRDTYSFLIKPAFERAVACGEIEAVPSLQLCGEYGHPLRTKKEGDVPTVLFKFSSRYLFSIFLRHGRLVIDDMNKTRGVQERLRLGRDLTFLNRKAMSFICQHNMTGKVRLSGTVVQYTLLSAPDTWISVHNPSGDCLATMGMKIASPFTVKPKAVNLETDDGNIAAVAAVRSAAAADVNEVVDAGNAVADLIVADGFQPAD